MRRLGLAILCVCIGTTGCQSTLSSMGLPNISLGGPGDEEQIAALLNDVHDGMQTRRIYKVLAHVSENYLDQDGRNYEAIRDYLQHIMKTYRVIRVTRARPRVLVYEDRARAVEVFGTIAEPLDVMDGTPINIQGHVSVYLERSGGVWKIVEWGRLQ